MTVFMLAAALVGPCCWVLSGVGLGTHKFAENICDMMQRHVDGELNPWVLDLARCDKLSGAFDSIGPMMRSANLDVKDANSKIDGARHHPVHFCNAILH